MGRDAADRQVAFWHSIERCWAKFSVVTHIVGTDRSRAAIARETLAARAAVVSAPNTARPSFSIVRVPVLLSARSLTAVAWSALASLGAACLLGEDVAAAAEPPGWSVDREDLGVVEETVQDRGGEDLVAE
jgi:hypothetical protein